MGLALLIAADSPVVLCKAVRLAFRRCRCSSPATLLISAISYSNVFLSLMLPNFAAAIVL